MRKSVPIAERRELPAEFPVNLRILTGQHALFRYKVNAVGFRLPGARKERCSGEVSQCWRKFLIIFAKNASIKASIKAPIALLALGLLFFAFGKLGRSDRKNHANHTS
ncbi:MAG: hypothetical protein NTU79_11175 [Planctomycetota bacterium]|nr:hypothetical protein [Planctomycetota bacterium]